jgi:hypothetical protein
MMVLMNNVMGLKNIITVAFLGFGDTLLTEKKGKKEGTSNNYAKWCKYLVVHYGFSPDAFQI